MKILNLIKCFVILSINLIQICDASEPVSHMYGPFLNFIDAGQDNDRWNISVLVIAPISDNKLPLNVRENGILREDSSFAEPDPIATINDYSFIRYYLSLSRDEEPKKISYQIGNGHEFNLFVPRKGSDPHVFLGSCNKYGNTTTMWQKINQKHRDNSFHLGILYGDQIYVDWGGKDNSGFFSIDSVNEIMTGDLAKRMATLTKTQEDSISKDLENFFLNHYFSYYSKPDFGEFLATVPCKSLSGDHEYYDGFGSYSNPAPIMSLIAQTAERFYLLFQHHTTKEKAENAGLIGRKIGNSLSSYNYLLQFETTTFFGLDTRKERTTTQIVTPQTINFMFSTLQNAKKQQNILLITEIPLIYQNVTPLYKILKFVENIGVLKYLYRKCTSIPDARSNIDISLDAFDSWSFVEHVSERNIITERLVNELVKERDKKVILIGGDVHSAGAGDVIDKSTKKTVLKQITSSSITSTPTPKFAVWLKKLFSYFQSAETHGDLIEKITGYSRDKDAQKSSEIALNNWLDIQVSDKQVNPKLWVLPSESQELESWTPEGW